MQNNETAQIPSRKHWIFTLSILTFIHGFQLFCGIRQISTYRYDGLVVGNHVSIKEHNGLFGMRYNIHYYCSTIYDNGKSCNKIIDMENNPHRIWFQTYTMSNHTIIEKMNKLCPPNSYIPVYEGVYENTKCGYHDRNELLIPMSLNVFCIIVCLCLLCMQIDVRHRGNNEYEIELSYQRVRNADDVV